MCIFAIGTCEQNWGRYFSPMPDVSHTGHAGWRLGWGGEGLELFAFSVSLFQREKEGSDLSHMRRRYMEGQRSRVGVSTTSHFLDLEFGSSRSPWYEMPSEMWRSPGKHRCPHEFRQRKKTQREVWLAVGGITPKVRIKKINIRRIILHFTDQIREIILLKSNWFG